MPTQYQYWHVIWVVGPLLSVHTLPLKSQHGWACDGPTLAHSMICVLTTAQEPPRKPTMGCFWHAPWFANPLPTEILHDRAGKGPTKARSMTLPPNTTQEPPLQPIMAIVGRFEWSIHHHPKSTMTEQPVGRHGTTLWSAHPLPPKSHQESWQWAFVGPLHHLPIYYRLKSSNTVLAKGRCRPALWPCLLMPPKSHPCSWQWAIVSPLWFVHTPPAKSHHDWVASGPTLDRSLVCLLTA